MSASKAEGAIRGLEHIKADFGMRGANATTIERAIECIRALTLAEVEKQRDVAATVMRDLHNRAETAEASLADLAAENERLADCLDCARQDWEANNGEIIDKTDPHWTVEARRLSAARALQDEAGKK